MAVALNTYLKKSDEINNIEALLQHFTKAIESFGYEQHVFIFFPPKKSAEETLPYCPSFNIPEKIIDIYISHELYQVGPIFLEVKTTGRPVLWSDFLHSEKDYERNPKLKEFIKLLGEHGYFNGITIPVFGVRNCFGHFSFTSATKKMSLEDPDLIILNHVCINLVRQYNRIKQLEKTIHPPLTPREKEVLSWVLKGKSNSVIAEIMEISEHTVNTYIKRSCKKLSASSKWSAGISAVLTGLLQY